MSVDKARPQLRLDIGICTYRRESLFSTLESIREQHLPADVSLAIIVADNDSTARLAPRLAEASQKLGLHIRYVHAPARNISIARNACLEAARGDLLVFVDDDELARPGWLAALVARWQESGAGVVFGPSLAVYPAGTPEWLVRLDAHSNIPLARDGTVETGYSSNVLLDLRQETIRKLRFDPLLGRTGGEDTDFFFRLHRCGIAMTIAEAAAVSEPVAPRRLSFGWLLGRRFANGQIYGHCVLRSGRQAGPAEHLTTIARALLKCGYCGLRALPVIFDRTRFAFWFLRGGFHMGVASGALSPPRTAHYGGE